jgi:hypothetical protein
MMMLMLMFQIKLIFECIKIIDLLDLLKKNYFGICFFAIDVMVWCPSFVLFFFAWLVHYYDQGWIWSGMNLIRGGTSSPLNVSKIPFKFIIKNLWYFKKFSPPQKEERNQNYMPLL